MNPKKKRIKQKKIKKNIIIGIVHVKTNYNNTIVTVTDTLGNAIASSSGGTVGFRGARKSTSFAAQQIARKAVSLAKECGLKQISFLIKGPILGKETAIRFFQESGFTITSMKDVTPIPHNGCRPPKRPRG